MEGDDGFTIWRLDGQMHPRNWSIGFVDKQLIGIEGTLAFDENVRQTERDEDSSVEAFAGFDIRHSQVHMINEPAAVKLHDCLPGA